MPEIHDKPIPPSNIRYLADRASTSRSQAPETLQDTLPSNYIDYLQIEDCRQKVYNTAAVALTPNTYVSMTSPEGKLRPYSEVFADVYWLIGETPANETSTLHGLYRDHTTTEAILQIATETVRPSTTKSELQASFVYEPYLTHDDANTLFATADRFLPGHNLPQNMTTESMRPSSIEAFAPTLRQFNTDFKENILGSFGISADDPIGQLLCREACYNIAVHQQLPENDIATRTALDQLGVDVKAYHNILATRYEPTLEPSK